MNRVAACSAVMLLMTAPVAASGQTATNRMSRSVAAAAGLSVISAAVAIYADARAEKAYREYSAASSDFDARWRSVRHWEIARDSAGFIAGAGALGALVFWFSRRGIKSARGISVSPLWLASAPGARIGWSL